MLPTTVVLMFLSFACCLHAAVVVDSCSVMADPVSGVTLCQVNLEQGGPTAIAHPVSARGLLVTKVIQLDTISSVSCSILGVVKTCTFSESYNVKAYGELCVFSKIFASSGGATFSIGGEILYMTCV